MTVFRVVSHGSHKFRCPGCGRGRFRCRYGIWTCLACSKNYIVRAGKLIEYQGDDAARSFAAEPIQNYQGDETK